MREVDRLEATLRLGCGGAVGVLLGAAIAVFAWAPGSGFGAVAAIGAAVGAVVCAAAALRLGDAFWLDLRRWVEKLAFWIP